jgi:non-specific serine/threonine protein kinase
MWPLWFLRDIMGDGRSWLEQLLPCAESFDPEARAELMWTALVAALEVGDDEAALAARQQLEPLLPVISDRFLQAAAQLAAAWSLPITGDNGAALHAASGSLEEFRRQDEPFWTALALGSIGTLEITAGHQDRALTHLREAVEVSDRFGSAFLSTFSRTLLSAVLIEHGRLDEAGALLQDALKVSLTAGSTRSVTLSLSGFARLAIAEGDLQRAALLAGAAEGLRLRAGLQAWPMMRAAEAELLAQGRQTLEPGQFDEMFADGTQLSSQEAVDVIHDDFVESKAS